MRKTGSFLLTLLVPVLLGVGLLGVGLLGSGLLAPTARADAPDGWHKSLADGVEAAGKSGKPILLITAWNRKL